LLPRPPSSTLFPYTTLFRSVDVDVQKAACLEGLGRRVLAHVIDSCFGVFVFCVFLLRLFFLGIVFGFVVIRGGLGGSYLKEGLGDRKSTRLNSSHSQISYAV